jgi:acyl carrier protein
MSIEGDHADGSAAGPRESPQSPPQSAAAISDWCVNYLATAMGVPPAQIDVGATFASLGMDSVVRTSFMFAIEELLNVPVASEDMIERPTIAALADHLAGHTQAGQGR